MPKKWRPLVQPAAAVDKKSGDIAEAEVSMAVMPLVVERLEDRLLYSADVLPLLAEPSESKTSDADESLSSALLADSNYDADHLSPPPIDALIDDEPVSTLVTPTVERAITSNSLTAADDAFSAELQSVLVPFDDGSIAGTSGLSGGVTLNTDGGNDSYLLVRDGGGLLGGLTEITVEATYNVDTFNSRNALFSYSAVTGPDTFKLLVRNNGVVDVGVLGTDVLSASVPELRNGEVHSVAASWQSATGSLKMYVDGQLVHSASNIATGQSLLPGGTLIMGMEQDSPGGGFELSEIFSGTLFEVRVWNEVRTAAEIAANAGHILDSQNLPAELIANWQMQGFNNDGEIVDVVGDHNLSVAHASGTGFSESTPVAGLRVSEGAANGTIVGSVVGSAPVSTDNTAAEQLQYTLLSDPSGALQLSSDGVITVIDGSAIDFEAGPTYDIQIRISNADGHYDELLSIPIDNDSKPELVNLEAGTLDYTANDPAIILTSTLSISDGDSVNMQTGTVRIIGGVAADNQLLFTDYGPFSSAFDVSSGLLTINGNASVSAWEAALRSVRYQNNSDAPLSGLLEVRFRVGDGDTLSPSVTRNIEISAGNNAPTLSDATLSDIRQNTTAPTGNTVADIFSGKFTDTDGSFSGIAVAGIAVNPTNPEGDWEYSADDGASWEPFDGLSVTSATFLDIDAMLRFVPAQGYIGAAPALTVYAIDDSYTEAYTSSTADPLGDDVSVRGDGTPYSADSATINVNVVSLGPIDLSSGVSLNTDGGNDAYLLVNNGAALLDGLTRFTIESQFSLEPPTTTYTPLFSYSTASGSSNEILLDISNDGTLGAHIRGYKITTDTLHPYLFDGQRHSIAMSWDSLNGYLALYVDGDLVQTQTGVETGHIIGSGALVLGQDQDEPLGAFDSDQVMRGTYYDLRIWNEVRSEAEISANHHHKLHAGALPATLIANWQMDNINGTNQITDVVAGNTIEVSHATGPGFTQSNPTFGLSVSEGAANGTVIGSLMPTMATVVEDLLLDGNFLSYSGAPIHYSAGQTIGGANGHWLVVSGDIDVETEWSGSPLGGHAIDLDGTEPGAISQTFTTAPGSEYVVSFAMTGNFQNHSSKSLTVSAGDSTESYTIDRPSDWTTDNLLWNRHSMEFTATSNSTTLTFASDAVSGNNGPVISDVQVTEVPLLIALLPTTSPHVHYDAGTDKLYALANTPTDWLSAREMAQSTTAGGVSGRLVTINSAYENSVVQSLAQSFPSDSWIGASDSDPEGAWYWHSDQNSDFQFWSGDEMGAAVNGAYANWQLNQPNGRIVENYAAIEPSSGRWYDRSASVEYPFIIEWDADQVLGAYTYSLISDSAGAFSIDATTGTISVADGSALDYETDASHDVVVRVTDVNGESFEKAITVSVTNVDTPPILADIESNPIVYTENSGAIGITGALTLVDNETLTSATISISGGYNAMEDRLGFADTDNIIGEWNETSGKLTLTGTGNAVEWQNALRSVTYVNTGEAPATTARTIEFMATNADGISNTLSRQIALIPVNDAPFISDGILADISEDDSNSSGDSIRNIFDGFSDVDGTFKAIGVIGDATADATNAEGQWQYSTDNGDNWYAIGAVSPDASVVIDADDNLRFVPTADYYGVVPALTVAAIDDSYSGAVSNGNDRVSKDLSVRGGATPYSSSSATISSQVVAVFDPPVNHGNLPSSVVTVEDVESVVDLGAVSLDSRDHAGSLTVRMSTGDGRLTWVDDPALDFKSDANTLEISGDASTLNTYLSGHVISYLHNTQHKNGTSADVISVSLIYTPDAHLVSGSGPVAIPLGNIDVSITPVNDAPVTDPAVVLPVIEDEQKTVPLSTFGFSDIHDNHNFHAVKIVTLPQHGVLSLDTVAVSAGDSISVSDIAADKLNYTAAVNAFGAGYDQFTFRVQDDGGSVQGGSDISTDKGVVLIDVAAVNDLPVLQVHALDAVRGQSHTLGMAHIAAFEPDVVDAQITITSVPAHGTIQRAGVTLNAGDTFTHADLVAGTVSYINDDASAANDAIGLTLYDQGADASTQSASSVLTINVSETHPYASPDSATVAEGQPADIDVLDNDVPADQPLNVDSVQIVTQPAHGTASADETGLITYVHSGSETATDSFSYAVSDTGGDTSNSSDVNVTITPVNDAPTALSVSASLQSHQTLTLTASDFGFIDAAENDGLNSVIIESLPSTGQLLFRQSPISAGLEIGVADLDSGLLSYTPAGITAPASQNSDDPAPNPDSTPATETLFDQFDYRVRDDGGRNNGGNDLSVASAVFLLEIEPVVAPATAPDTPQPFSVYEDAAVGTVVGYLSIADTDPTFTHIEDSGFDSALVTEPDVNRYAANGGNLGAWQVTEGSIDLHGNFWQQGPDGGLALELNGAEAGAIEQSFATLPGAQYTLTFMVSGDFRYADTNQSALLEVSVADQLITISVDNFPDWREQNLQWRQETISFTATSSTTSLSFKSLNAGTNGPLVTDIQIRDDVSYEASGPFAVLDTGAIVVADPGLDFEAQHNYQIDVLASAESGSTELLNASIDILDVNEKPILQLARPVQMFVGSTISIDNSHLLADDFDASDQPSDSIFYVVTQPPVTGQLIVANEVIGAGDVFTQQQVDSGQISFTHTGDDSATDRIYFQLRDGGEDNAGSSAGELTIHIDHPLQFTGSDTWPIIEQSVLTLTPNHVSTSGGFTADDDLWVELTQAPETSRLIIANSGSAIQGFTISELATGMVQLQHDGSEPRPDFLQLSLFKTDTTLPTLVATRTIELSIADLANAPTATDSTLFTDHLTALTIGVAQTGFSDGDDGDTLAFITIVESPISGTLELDGNTVGAGDVVLHDALQQGLLRYVPNPSVAGTITDNIAFRVTDSGSLTTGGVNESQQPANLTIEVTSRHAPVALADTIAVGEGESASALVTGATSVLANDIDRDTPLSLLRAALVTPPAHGTLELGSDGHFSYTHDGTETVSDSFRYVVFDSDNDPSDPATDDGAAIGVVDIQVLPRNDRPVAGNTEDQAAIVDEAFILQLPVDLFTDVDDDELMISAELADGSVLPEWLHFDATTQMFSGTPGNDSIGTLVVALTALDAAGATAQSTFQIIVEPQPASALPETPPETHTETPPEETTEEEVPKLPVGQLTEQTDGQTSKPSVDQSTDEAVIITAAFIDPAFIEHSAIETSVIDTVVDAVLPNTVAGDAVAVDAAAFYATQTQEPLPGTNLSQDLADIQRDSITAPTVEFKDVIVQHATHRAVDTGTANLNTDDSLVIAPEVKTFDNGAIDPQLQSLIRKLDNGAEEINNSDARLRAIQTGAISVSAGLAISYAWWILRSGFVLSSVLAAMPAWRLIDPLPVLDHSADEDDDEDNESLETMVSHKEKSTPVSSRNSASPPPS